MLFNNRNNTVKATKSSKINVKDILTTLCRVLQQTVLLALGSLPRSYTMFVSYFMFYIN